MESESPKKRKSAPIATPPKKRGRPPKKTRGGDDFEPERKPEEPGDDFVGRKKSSRLAGKKYQFTENGVNKFDSDDLELLDAKKCVSDPECQLLSEPALPPPTTRVAKINGDWCNVHKINGQWFKSKKGELAKEDKDRISNALNLERFNLSEDDDIVRVRRFFSSSSSSITAGSSGQKGPVMCTDCGSWFVNAYNVIRHQNGGTCNKPFCTVKHEHNLIDKLFDTLEEARDWIRDMHLDKDFQTVRSTTKIKTKTKNCEQAYYSCMVGNRKPRKKKIKVNPDTTVILEDESQEWNDENSCPAQIKIKARRVYDKRSDEKGLFRLTGCLSHNHDLLPNQQRVPARVKEAIVMMLNKGMSVNDIMNHKFDSPKLPNYESTRVFLHRNIIMTLKNKGLDGGGVPDKELTEVMTPMTTVTQSIPEVAGLAEQYLLWDNIVGFNLPNYDYDSPILSPELREKFLHTQNNFAVMFMSEEQQLRLGKYPHTLILDVTHVEKGRCPNQIITGLVVDSKSESSPVFQVIVENPKIEVFSAILTRLKILNVDATAKLKYLCCRMIDSKLANEIHADSKSIFGEIIKPIYTIKQFLQNLKHDYRNADLLNAVNSLQQQQDVEQFNALLVQLQTDFGQLDECKKFLNEYGPDGSVIPCQYWALCHDAVMLPANIGIKFYKTEIIRMIKAENTDIETAILPKLVQLDNKYTRLEEIKVLEVGQQVKSNKRSFLVAFEKCHVNAEGYDVHLQEDSTLIITNNNNTEGDPPARIKFRTGFTICEETLCQTRCSQCPSGRLCAHAFHCFCPQFVAERICPHLHIAISVCTLESGMVEDPVLLHKKMVTDGTTNIEPSAQIYVKAEEPQMDFDETKIRALETVQKLAAVINEKNYEEKAISRLETVIKRCSNLCDLLQK